MIRFDFNMDDIERRIEMRFQNLPERIADKVDLEVQKTALKMERQAKLLAHVDTGEMRQKIRTVSIKKAHYKVEAYAHHAKHEEFGTRHRPAHPFMRPAYIKYKDGMVQAIQEIIRGEG